MDAPLDARPGGYGVAPDGHRLPPGTRPGRVRLQVGDLERSLAYYRRVLGMRVLSHAAGRAALGPVTGDEATLVELVERPGAAPAPRGGRLGLFHFALLLPDRAALGRFAAHLAGLGVAAGASDHAVSEAFYLHDPDGLGIEVYADRPRSAWRHANRQLLLVTEPLDVPSVVAAGAGEPWTGMPAGTRMGHVHLHVGDLALAEAFYHQGLGLDKVVWDYPGALFLSAGGYHHHLGLNTWARSASPAADGEARLLEWELLVPGAPDADRARRHLEAAGHAVERSGDGAVVRDPWGTALRLTARERDPAGP